MAKCTSAVFSSLKGGKKTNGQGREGFTAHPEERQLSAGWPNRMEAGHLGQIFRVEKDPPKIRENARWISGRSP